MKFSYNQLFVKNSLQHYWHRWTFQFCKVVQKHWLSINQAFMRLWCLYINVWLVNSEVVKRSLFIPLWQAMHFIKCKQTYTLSVTFQGCQPSLNLHSLWRCKDNADLTSFNDYKNLHTFILTDDGRRSLWDREDVSPIFMKWGTSMVMSPPIL